jgi:hypothetical protein
MPNPWVGSCPNLQTVDWHEIPAKDKNSSFLRKFVNYGQKSFVTLTTGPQGEM